jgi:hypothetical protein
MHRSPHYPENDLAKNLKDDCTHQQGASQVRSTVDKEKDTGTYAKTDSTSRETRNQELKS